jgi:hypothetical protein
VVDGPGPSGRYYSTMLLGTDQRHGMTLIGSKLFVFGGISPKADFNDIWALDLNFCTFVPRFTESFSIDQVFNGIIESFLGVISTRNWKQEALSRAGHVSVTTGDRIIMFVSLLPPSL